MRTILVTGATDGLGRHLAARLGQRGAHVLVHGRDAAKAAAVRDEVAAAGGPEPAVVVADLADLRAVARLADDVAALTPRLDVLVNNAGVGFGAPGAAREVSRDGIELRFAVNYLAPRLLTRRLLPLLTAGAPARIVNVASAGQAAIDFADPTTERDYTGVLAYCRSKLAMVIDTFDLADELRGQGVTANALHPATFMATTMVHQAGTQPLNTVETGGNAVLRLMNAPTLDGVTGRYFDVQAEARADDQAYDAAARWQLQHVAEELTAKALHA